MQVRRKRGRPRRDKATESRQAYDIYGRWRRANAQVSEDFPIGELFEAEVDELMGNEIRRRVRVP